MILAHPNPQSFNGLVARTYCDVVRAHGQDAILRDLYATGFDPVLRPKEQSGGPDQRLSPDVAAERDLLRGTDIFVLVFPIWYGMPPTMLVGYLDRVLGAGISVDGLRSEQGTPLVAGKRLVTISTAGSSRSWLHQQGQTTAFRSIFGRYLRHGFGMSGYASLELSEVTQGLDQDYLDPYLHQVREFATGLCRELAQDKPVSNAAPTARRRSQAAASAPKVG